MIILQLSSTTCPYPDVSSCDNPEKQCAPIGFGIKPLKP